MNQRTEQEIMKNWKTHDRPLVSICCTAYNHEPYIEEAIESFLMQKTDFPFEVLVHDDCSTDGTANIIREYEKKYPNIIKPIYQKENQYLKGIKIGPTFIYPRAKGEYIALCEGDDYWTDPEKLQIQIDFLEKNEEYVISGHDAFIVDENGKHIKDSKLPKIYKKNFSKEKLILNKSWILTMSMVFRNVLHGEFPEEYSKVLNGDVFLLSLLGHYGKGKYHSNIKSAGYRVHPLGIWSLLSEYQKSDAKLNTFFWMYKYYSRIEKKQFANVYLFKYYSVAISRINYLLILKESLYRPFRLLKQYIKHKIK